MTNRISVSRLPVSLEILNKGLVQCEMIRHLAPLSVGAILKGLPLRDRVHKLADKLVYMETGLIIGAEKQKTQFRRGDLAFMTSNGSICIFIKDSVVTSMTHIGIVKSNLEVLETTQTGDIMILNG